MPNLKTFLIITLIFIQGCSWSFKDKILLCSFTALNMVDAYQTNKAFKDRRYDELNPLMTEQTMMPIKITVNGLVFVKVDKMEDRTTPLAILTAIMGGVVFNNAQVMD